MNDRSLAISLRADDSYRLGEPVVITVEVENRDGDPLRLLAWATPFEEVFTGSFLTVERDGEVLPYDGKLVKRGDASPGDYLTIGAGATAETTVDISAGYPIDRPGEYTVAVNTEAFDAFSVPGEEAESSRSRDQYEGLSLSSPVVTFTVLPGEEPRPTDGARARADQPQPEGGQEVAAEGESAAESGGAVEPNFIGGTPEQQNQTRTAHRHAQAAAATAASHLTEEGVNSLYREWFGQIPSPRYGVVTSNYRKISGTLSSKQLTYNLTGEGCEPGVYAYTYHGSSTVWLCSAFWEAPEEGSDTKFGTIVHEWSHALCGTEDYAYGEEACARLARTNPDKAIANADNYEYFVEHQ